MAIEILGGDYGKCKASLNNVGIVMPSGVTPYIMIENIYPITEQNVKKVAGTLGGGIVGGLLLGPLGAIGGMLIGGNKNTVSFVVVTKGGQQFIAKAEKKDFERIYASYLS